MKKIAVGKLVSTVIADLPPRQKEVLEFRYGLKNKTEMTLAEIGERYKVTRERIRQIESLALASIKNKLQQKDFQGFVDWAVAHLEKMGGVRRADLLSDDVKKISPDAEADKAFANKVRFLLEVSDQIKYRLGDNDYHAFWYVNETAHQGAADFINRLTNVLVAEQDWRPAMKASFAENYLSLSKKFSFNSYGEFGLIEWPHINPKTARDWAFLVLKKAQKPLHFTELARVINGLRKDKNTNVQTVHNELIKDNRFVLVGRGVYGLKEFNLMAGTCREVISQILKENGPQNTKELIRLVIAKRDFKENTLILNLQSKKHFVRLNDGRYTVREL